MRVRSIPKLQESILAYGHPFDPIDAEVYKKYDYNDELHVSTLAWVI